MQDKIMYWAHAININYREEARGGARKQLVKSLNSCAKQNAHKKCDLGVRQHTKQF
jgi:hypothetical protein